VSVETYECSSPLPVFPTFEFELQFELDALMNPSHPTDDIGEES